MNTRDVHIQQNFRKDRSSRKFLTVLPQKVNKPLFRLKQPFFPDERKKTTTKHIRAFITKEKKTIFNQRVLCITHPMLPIDFFHVEHKKEQRNGIPGRRDRLVGVPRWRLEARHPGAPRSFYLPEYRLPCLLLCFYLGKVGFVVSGLCVWHLFST